MAGINATAHQLRRRTPPRNQQDREGKRSGTDKQLAQLGPAMEEEQCFRRAGRVLPQRFGLTAA
jgi:hypothetical protein